MASPVTPECDQVFVVFNPIMLLFSSAFAYFISAEMEYHNRILRTTLREGRRYRLHRKLPSGLVATSCATGVWCGVSLDGAAEFTA